MINVVSHNLHRFGYHFIISIYQTRTFKPVNDLKSSSGFLDSLSYESDQITN